METNDKNEILRLLSEGKITASEAVELLDKSGSSRAPQGPGMAEAVVVEKAPPATELDMVDFPASEPFKIKVTEDDLALMDSNGKRPRWLKIRVSELSSGRNKVNISLPMGFVGFGLGIARRFGADFDDEYKIDEMWSAIKQGERGVLVDVEDEEDDEHVQIFLD